jgi:hypothetical protein
MAISPREADDFRRFVQRLADRFGFDLEMLRMIYTPADLEREYMADRHRPKRAPGGGSNRE